MTLVSKTPGHFPFARDFTSECGPHQLQAVIRAFGADATIEELYLSERHKKHDWSLPWNMPKILERYGVLAKMGFWMKPSFADQLAASIEADRPTLFVVNSIQGDGNLHWISAWGHDTTEEERHFLCYDSQLPASTEPHGNARYHAAILEEALPWYGTFAITIQ
jgi:hypothetical protein